MAKVRLGSGASVSVLRAEHPHTKYRIVVLGGTIAQIAKATSLTALVCVARWSLVSTHPLLFSGFFPFFLFLDLGDPACSSWRQVSSANTSPSALPSTTLSISELVCLFP